MSKLRGIATMLTVAMLCFIAAGAQSARGDETASPTASHHQHHDTTMTSDPLVSIPAEPVEGVIAIVIPHGVEAAMRTSGDTGYHMPPVIRLHVGDTITIRNDDDAPHMILFTFLMPGESESRTFTAAGSETYSSGCAAHAASFPDFTTIFISEP